MKTKKGIYLDLKESDYLVKVGTLTFYFSSELYMKKFRGLLPSFIKEETMKLQIKYVIEINCEMYLALALYKRIEKRGFRVYDDVLKEELKYIKFITSLLK